MDQPVAASNEAPLGLGTRPASREIPAGVLSDRTCGWPGEAIDAARALASGSMAGAGDIEAVLERLDQVMAEHAPELRSSLRPPVDSRALEQLRRAVDPFELPGDVEALLRWADGQSSAASLPTLASCGALLSATAIVEHYRFLRNDVEDWQWCPLWVPIARDGWSQAGVEMTENAGAVLDVHWGDPDVSVIAPSLVVLLVATADMIEAGLSDWPVAGDAYTEWRSRCRLILEAREEWTEWPYDRVIASEIGGWPPHWRVAAGRPPQAEVPHPPAAPISTVLAGTAGQSEPATIEGYVTDRALIDGQASGNSIIALDDGTGSVRVLVQPKTEGSYWAAWVGRRIQVDVLAGTGGLRTIDEVLDAAPDRRRRAPVGNCVLAVEVRVGVQRSPTEPDSA